MENGSKTSPVAPIIALPSSFSKVDEYGFERSEAFNAETYEEFTKHYYAILARRALKWKGLLQISGSLALQPSKILKRYIRKGIPAEHRPRKDFPCVLASRWRRCEDISYQRISIINYVKPLSIYATSNRRKPTLVWMAVSGAQKLKEANPDLYSSLLLASYDERVVEAVQNDIPRTFPENIYFANEPDGLLRPLFNILITYAHHNPIVGYCQGMNYIAGLLLLVTRSEETSFWLLKALVENKLPAYYTRDMKGVITDIDVLSELVKMKAKPSFNHIQELNLPWPVFVTRWFICLYADVLPVETVLRIWDCLFYEGSKILFRVGLTLIKSNQNQLIRCRESGELNEFFKAIAQSKTALDCHKFLESLFTVPGSLSHKTIESLREKHSHP